MFFLYTFSSLAQSILNSYCVFFVRVNHHISFWQSRSLCILHRLRVCKTRSVYPLQWTQANQDTGRDRAWLTQVTLEEIGLLVLHCCAA